MVRRDNFPITFALLRESLCNGSPWCLPHSKTLIHFTRNKFSNWCLFEMTRGTKIMKKYSEANKLCINPPRYWWYISCSAWLLGNDMLTQRWNRFPCVNLNRPLSSRTCTHLISPQSAWAVQNQSHLPFNSMKWDTPCCNKSAWCPVNKSVSHWQYLSEQFQPAYLIFAQQYFSGECWGADIIRSGVRCDRDQCPDFAILGENYKYVITELCTDDFCWDSVDFSLSLSCFDDRLRHFLNPTQKKKRTNTDYRMAQYSCIWCLREYWNIVTPAFIIKQMTDYLPINKHHLSTISVVSHSQVIILKVYTPWVWQFPWA